MTAGYPAICAGRGGLEKQCARREVVAWVRGSPIVSTLSAVVLAVALLAVGCTDASPMAQPSKTPAPDETSTVDASEESTVESPSEFRAEDAPYEPPPPPPVRRPAAGTKPRNAGRGHRPMLVRVTVEPPQPTANQPVRFRVEAFDVDAVIHPGSCGNFEWFGDEETPLPFNCVLDCAVDDDAPPPKRRRGHLVRELTHTYDAPGVYRARFHYYSSGDCEPNPYASEGDAVVTVQVR